MGKVAFSNPVEDTVPMVDETLAVGEDLQFQERWWRFEHAAWIFFCFVLLADVLGVFGRGWLANAQRKTTDGSMTVKYDRIDRASTPSVISILLGPQAFENGQARLYVSGSVVKELGAERIVPQPQVSTVGNDGVTYTFSATAPPATVQIELQPNYPGMKEFAIGRPGGELVHAKVFVMP
jgi:hypothetical protein